VRPERSACNGSGVCCLCHKWHSDDSCCAHGLPEVYEAPPPDHWANLIEFLFVATQLGVQAWAEQQAREAKWRAESYDRWEAAFSRRNP